MYRFSPARLRSARRRADVKPEQLALELGRSAFTVSAWERGLCCPSATMLGRIAGVLRVSPAELYDEVPA